VGIEEPVIVLGGLGPSRLGLLMGQVRRDLMRVGDLINDIDWMIASSPPFLRPLAEQGFEARMGIGLRDWENTTDALLESLRDMERARLDRDTDLFMRHAGTFLPDSLGAVASLRTVLNGISALPSEAPSEIGAELEGLVLRQAEMVGDLLISLEMLNRQLGRGSDLISSKQTF